MNIFSSILKYVKDRLTDKDEEQSYTTPAILPPEKVNDF